MQQHDRPTTAAQPISSQLDDISARLVGARRQAEALSEFPGELPATLEDAYAIQNASIERWNDSVAGWKIGMLSPSAQETYSTQRLCGPIFRSSIHRVEAGGQISMPIYVGGFAAAEAEFVIELGETRAPIPGSLSQGSLNQGSLSDHDLMDLVSGLYVGVEIASSPMAAINELGPTCVVSDFGNNAGLVLGPKIPNWRSHNWEDLTSKVIVDGTVVGDASAAAIPGSPLQAFRFLLEHFASQGREMPAGTLVSTGASTGIHDVVVTSRSTADFGELGSIDVLFEPMVSAQ